MYGKLFLYGERSDGGFRFQLQRDGGFLREHNIGIGDCYGLERDSAVYLSVE